ncbi:MAG TPA: alpha-L-fucosidase, partial [Phycisphaerae bacterium]|nr:alpha-L-fucosidase [Phycisphaerae bacterium]
MLLTIGLCLVAGTAAGASPHYEPTWESIDNRPTPAWFSEAKFGI